MPPPPNDPPKPPSVAETLTAAPSGEPAASVAPAPHEDDTCDPVRYEVVGEHGRGGLGRVLRAFDRRLGRTVAIKELLHRGSENEARFVREALLTARLEHPSIVAVHDAGRWPSGDRFYSMKLISGRSLKELINERPRLADRLGLLSNLIAVADAVAYAHSHGVIHRDLKPANIIVGEYGETAVIDWGLAKELSDPASDAASFRGNSIAGDADLTVVGAVIGTPAYMSPEQARGEPVDERADVYGLGAILYHVLAGKVPYSASDGAETVAKVASEPPQPLAELAPEAPLELVAIAARAMARSPVDRYPNAQAFAEDIRRFQTGKLVGAHAYSLPELVARSMRRHKYAVAVTLAALVVVGALGAFSVRRILRERDRADANAARVTEMLAESFADHGRRAVVERDDRDGLRYLRKALELGHDDPTLRLSVELALRPFDARKGRVATGASVTDIEYSTDGKLIAAAGVNGAHVFDEAGRVTAHLRSGNTESARFSPSGHAVVTASADGTVTTWDVHSGQPLRVLQRGRGTWSVIAQYRPDGAEVLGAWQDGVLRTWSASTNRELRSVQSGHEQLWCARYSPDGRWIGTAGADGVVRIWDAGSLSLAREIHGHTSGVRNITFDDHSQHLVSAGHDGRVIISAMATGRPAATFRAEGRMLHTATLSPSGDHVAALGDGGPLVWRLHEHISNALPFDGSLTATKAEWLGGASGSTLIIGYGDGGVQLWDASDGLELLRIAAHEGAVTRVAVSPTKETFATSSHDGTVAIWSTNTRSFKSRTHTTAWATALQRAGSHFFVANLRGVVTLVRGSDAEQVLEAGTETWCLALADHEHLLATGGGYGARLWDLRSRTMIASTDERSDCGGATALSFSEDGGELLVACWRGPVQVLEVPSLHLLRSWSGHSGGAAAAAFSAVRDEIVSVGFDGVSRTWRRSADEPVLERRVHDYYVAQLLQDPRGAWRATASHDGTARIWNPESGALLVSTDNHGVPVFDVALVQGVGFFATAAGQNIPIWDMTTGKRLATLGNATDRAVAVEFTEDGRELWVLDIDGTVTAWDMSLREATTAELMRAIDCALEEPQCDAER